MGVNPGNIILSYCFLWKIGGEGEIRTHGPREGTPVFKTGAINRSATSPVPSRTYQPRDYALSGDWFSNLRPGYRLNRA